METKKSKKWLLIIPAILVLLAIGFFIVKNLENNTTTQNEECDSCKVEPNLENKENTEQNKYSGETVEYNAYDFIIETLAKAQYWGSGEFPYYDNPEANEKARTYLAQTNGTGFKLYDEETATFCRGYEGRLWINFSENKAMSNPENSPSLTYRNPDREIDKNEEITYLDFNNGTCFTYNEAMLVADENERRLYNATPDGYMHANVLSKEEHESTYYYDVDDFYWTVKNTLDYYENIFKEVGCPLTNQPKGTLSSYKNKTINVPVELVDITYTNPGDNLIHAIWEQEDFAWDWATNKDNIWLDNMADIYNQEFPKTVDAEMQTIEHVALDGTSTFELTDYYGGLWLVRADPSQSSRYVDCLTIFIDPQYENSGGALATYWLRPILKEVYDQDVVYFYEEPTSKYDPTKYHPGEINIKTKEDFLTNTTVPLDTVCVLYNKGDVAVGGAYELSSYLATWQFDEIAYYVQRICEHYGFVSPYGRDYLQNLYIYYNMNAQRRLGLR